MKTLLALLSLALVLPAAARIGETPEQLATRYGKAWSTQEPEVMVYQKNGVFVVARIWNGTCHRIEFSVSPPIGPFEPTLGQEKLPKATLLGLNEKQKAALVEANKGNSEWKRFNPGGATSTLDGSRMVEFPGENPMIVIVTKAWMDHKLAEQKSKDAAVTEGF